AIALAQVESNFEGAAAMVEGDIGTAIAIEVGGHNPTRVSVGGDQWKRLKGAIALAEKDAGVGGVYIGGNNVGDTIAIEVGYGGGGHAHARNGECDWRSESAGSVARQNRGAG